MISQSIGSIGGAFGSMPSSNVIFDIRVLDRTLTTAELDTSFAAPVTLVQGVANKVIVPVGQLFAYMTHSGSWGGGGNGMIRHLGGGISMYTWANGLASVAGSSFTVAIPAAAAYGVGGFNPTGIDLVFQNSVDLVPGAQTGSIRIVLPYVEASVT